MKSRVQFLALKDSGQKQWLNKYRLYKPKFRPGTHIRQIQWCESVITTRLGGQDQKTVGAGSWPVSLEYAGRWQKEDSPSQQDGRWEVTPQSCPEILIHSWLLGGGGLGEESVQICCGGHKCLLPWRAHQLSEQLVCCLQLSEVQLSLVNGICRPWANEFQRHQGLERNYPKLDPCCLPLRMSILKQALRMNKTPLFRCQ